MIHRAGWYQGRITFPNPRASSKMQPFEVLVGSPGDSFLTTLRSGWHRPGPTCCSCPRENDPSCHISKGFVLSTQDFCSHTPSFPRIHVEDGTSFETDHDSLPNPGALISGPEDICCLLGCFYLLVQALLSEPSPCCRTGPISSVSLA